MSWPRYWELECANPACSNTEAWEVYARAEDYGDGDGSFDLIPVPDGPGLSGGSTRCEVCGEEGDLL